MRGWCRVLFAAVFVVTLAGPAHAGIADQVGATFGLILQDVVAAFPPIEGLVVQVDGDSIYIDLAKKNGVLAGQEFTVFRKGEVFRHPNSGKPLGRYEEVLGYAQVQRVEAAFSEAAFVSIEGRPRPRPEDGVRITRGRIRVAVVPPVDLTTARADLRRVPFMLALAMDQTRRFQSVDSGQVNETLLNSKTKGEELLVRPDRAVSLGKSLDVTAWLVPVLIERRGITYLDVTFISAVTGAALYSKREALTRSEGAGEQRFPWEPRPED
ncbi:MAG: hypothetical protein Q7W02_25940 [Candidatus Rokubacteria bacterium]|nr:hypothetical protein [Candidatus Rokubacteria bacterium]